MKAKRHPERGSKKLKILDRYIGIPLVCILGLFHKKAGGRPSTMKRVALLKTAGIGDTIILSGVIRDMRRKLPDAEVTLVCGKNNYETAGLIREVDNIVRLDIKNIVESIRSVRRLGEFDAWLDFGPWPRYNAVVSFFALARYKVGFKTKGQHRHYVYDTAVDHADHVPDFHELENYRNIVKEIGIACESLPRVEIDTKDMQIANDRVAIHIYPGGSRSYLKEWPEGHWIDLMNWFIGRRFNICLTGGIEDADGLERIRGRVENPDSVSIAAGKYSLKETASLLAASRLVIGTDTGTMHLASALGCDTISIHGPTSPERWGALGEKSRRIKTGCACAPCIDFGFDSRCRDNRCMQGIPSEAVIEECRKILSD